MPFSANTRSYAHIAAVLDAAITAGGGRYTLESKKAAVRWRSQAYHYRMMLQREETAKLGLPGRAGATPYDTMYLTLDDATVVIGVQSVKGTLVVNGEEVRLDKPALVPLEPASVLTSDDDALLEQATGFTKGSLL